MNEYYKSYRYVTNSKKSIGDISLGTGLKEFIKEKYGTSKKLAQILKMSESHIALIIKGKRRIPPELKHKLIKDGFNEAEIYNYIQSDKLELNGDFLEIVIQLKAIIDRQKNLLEFYERAIIDLRGDYDNLRKSKLTKIDKSVNSTI